MTNMRARLLLCDHEENIAASISPGGSPAVPTMPYNIPICFLRGTGLLGYSPFVVLLHLLRSLEERQHVFVAMTRGISGFQAADLHNGMSVISQMLHAA
jgi:hypothetical protein